MKSPFKFLDSYTKDDRDVFFGRDREIEELYHRIFEGKLMLVYGVSGTGKSSLIHCGLANKFRETDWLPLIIRRGGNIIESMASSINSSSITPQEGQIITPAQFKKGVRSLYLDHYKPVFFIFDQFEELFIFGDKEERKSFVQVIKSLIESDLQCRLIFVMREEYMAGVTEFERYIPSFFSNRVRIEKMSHINAIEAINGPCKVFNIILEELFAESLLEKLSPESSDVELTYLQVFLDKIFHLAGGEKDHKSLSFTLSLLGKAGNVSDLLGSFLEEQIKELDEPDSGLTILKSFVAIKGTKKQLTHDEVIEFTRSLGKDTSVTVVSELLQKFVNLRILRDKDENGKYELRHDSLATKIYEKITIVEKELMEIYQFLENSYSAFAKRKALLSSNDLKYIAPYEDRLFLHNEIADFIEKSKEELNKVKRRIKRVALAGFGAILFFSIGAILMTYRLPFAGTVRLLGLIVYLFWFLPLFGYNIFKTTENRTINILFLIFTLFFVGNIYLYNTSIRNVLIKPIYSTEQKYQLVLEKFRNGNDSIYKLVDLAKNKENIPFSLNQAAEYNKYKTMIYSVKQRADEMNDYIQSLKIEIILTTEGTKNKAISENKINLYRIKKINDSNVPSAILIGLNNNGKATDLKYLLIDYKEFLSSILVENNKTVISSFNSTLNTEDFIGSGGTTKWENFNFQDLSLGFVIINLTKIQLDIKNAESEVLTILYDKMNERLQQVK